VDRRTQGRRSSRRRARRSRLSGSADLSPALVNLLVELDDARFAQPEVHHALEALGRRGIAPLREHRTPERILGWIDAQFGGSWSSEAAAGGIWIAQDETSRPLGFAAYDARGLDFFWLRPWRERPWVGIFGPFGVVPEARGAGLGTTLLHAALFSLAERGYRQALIPAVGDPALAAYYERAAHARVVESIDLRRGRRHRTTVLASGNGSNFQAVADAAASGALPLEVTALVVNRPDAFALQRARAAGIAAHVVAWNRAHESREAYDARVLEAVAATDPELVLLLGWMHVLPAPFVARFPQTLNLHPAFLPLDAGLDTVTMPDGSAIPAYRGAHAVDAALAAGSGWIGATVHRLAVAVDRGAVLARAPLAVRPDETRDALEARLHELEHRVLAGAIRRWSWEQA
jgi:phosphoribosylglycinamide formyltransferase-1